MERDGNPPGATDFRLVESKCRRRINGNGLKYVQIGLGAETSGWEEDYSRQLSVWPRLPVIHRCCLMNFPLGKESIQLENSLSQVASWD